jgi:hypothetical protein
MSEIVMLGKKDRELLKKYNLLDDVLSFAEIIKTPKFKFPVVGAPLVLEFEFIRRGVIVLCGHEDLRSMETLLK